MEQQHTDTPTADSRQQPADGQQPTIRETIEAHIRSRGMSKRDLAEQIGRTSGSLNALLASPSWPSLQKIAAVLGMSVAELVSDSPASSGDASATAPQHQAVCPHCGRAITVRLE